MKHQPQPTTPTAAATAVAEPTNPPATAGGTDTRGDGAHAAPADDALTQLRAENERLKKQIAEQAAHSSLKDKLKQAGARTPKLLLEAAKHALQFTAAGELENAVEIIEALKEKFPEQFGASHAPAIPSIDAGAGRVSKPGLTREALAKMKPAEIAELNWDDVRRVLAAK
jgi:hypothetical protein